MHNFLKKYIFLFSTSKFLFFVIKIFFFPSSRWHGIHFQIKFEWSIWVNSEDVFNSKHKVAKQDFKSIGDVDRENLLAADFVPSSAFFLLGKSYGKCRKKNNMKLKNFLLYFLPIIYCELIPSTAAWTMEPGMSLWNLFWWFFLCYVKFLLYLSRYVFLNTIWHSVIWFSLFWKCNLHLSSWLYVSKYYGIPCARACAGPSPGCGARPRDVAHRHYRYLGLSFYLEENHLLV